MKKQIALLTLLQLILFLCSFGQIQIANVKLKPEDIPKSIKYSGKVIEALRWKDKTGENLVIITETGEYPSPEENFDNYRDAKLYTYHFLIFKDSFALISKVYDYVKNCPVDIKASFIKNALQITDINHNGIAEVWVVYKVACLGDVSPSEMKIIMHEGQKKYAMRGHDKVKVSQTTFEGGDFKFDLEFLNERMRFKEFAIQLWNKCL